MIIIQLFSVLDLIIILLLRIKLIIWKKHFYKDINLLKTNLSHKSWLLNEKTLIEIYNVLIRSIIDYSAILSPIISKTNLNTLQIFRKKTVMSETTLDWLHKKANLIRIETRMINLRKRYIFKAIENNNPMILDLISEYLNFKGGNPKP